MSKKTPIMLIVLLLSACSVQPSTDQPTILATFFPLQDMTQRIVGSSITVHSLIPAGIEPHDYEPSPHDVRKLNSAKAFVTMGLEFEELENRLLTSTPHVKKISASSQVALLKVEEQESEEEHGEEHTGIDPHIWLSPKNMIIMTQNINDGLKNVMPQKAAEFDRNAQHVVAELLQLDTDFKTGLSNCKKDTILVSHRAFAYLANEYGFKQVSIAGLEPESEPSPKELKKLIDAAKEHNIKYIFYEELVDPRVSQTIANEVGAKTLELNPLEGTKDPNATYESLMRRNLNNLRIALECE